MGLCRSRPRAIFFRQFWQGGALLRQSPPQHLSVRFACGKLHLVGEVSPFDSELTARGLLTGMQSGTPSKSAEGDFFRQFWQGGALLRRSHPQHLSVQFTRGKLCLVGEVSPFDSEFTARGSLTRMRSGTPSKSAEGNFFRGVIEKHVSEDDGMFTLRVEGFFRLRIYICIKQSRG